MKLKEYLLTLTWNSFSKYPAQGENIFLHCTSCDGKQHHFIKLNNFNAVKLDLDKIANLIQSDQKWLYTWLPADVINQSNV